MRKSPYIIVKLEGYDGMDTSISLDPDPMFVIVHVPSGTVDYGYRTYNQAASALGKHKFLFNPRRKK